MGPPRGIRPPTTGRIIRGTFRKHKVAIKLRGWEHAFAFACEEGNRGRFLTASMVGYVLT
jgi:hypothetical protein